ncbi:MAG: ABC transporter permease [Pyrinomonadaceae bacterium]
MECCDALKESALKRREPSKRRTGGGAKTDRPPPAATTGTSLLAWPANQNLTLADVVDLKYFETMGIALLRGRDFAAQDREGSTGVVIINETFTGRYFPGKDPIGRRLSLNRREGPWWEVVGVARDAKYLTLGELPTPFIYQNLRQRHESGMVLHVRTGGGPENFVAAVRKEVQAIEKNLPVTNLQPMTELLDNSLSPARVRGRTAARRLRLVSAIVSGCRPLRSDVFLGFAPHARDRYSDGVGGAENRRPSPGAARKHDVGWIRHHTRPSRGFGRNALARQFSLRREHHRPFNLWRHCLGLGNRGLDGKSHPGTPSIKSRSDGGAQIRVSLFSSLTE